MGWGGGGGGIRTHGRLAPSPVFKTGAIDRSATPPRAPSYRRAGAPSSRRPFPRCRRRLNPPGRREPGCDGEARGAGRASDAWPSPSLAACGCSRRDRRGPRACGSGRGPRRARVYSREGPAVRDAPDGSAGALGRGRRPAPPGAGAGRQPREPLRGGGRALRRARQGSPGSASPTRPPTPSALATGRPGSALPRCAASWRLIQLEVDFDSLARFLYASGGLPRRGPTGSIGYACKTPRRRPLPRRLARAAGGRRLRHQGAASRWWSTTAPGWCFSRRTPTRRSRRPRCRS